MEKLSRVLLLAAGLLVATGSVIESGSKVPNPGDDTPLIDQVDPYGPESVLPSSEDGAQGSLVTAMDDKFQHATLEDKLSLSEWKEPKNPTPTHPDAETQTLAPVADPLPSTP